MATEKFKALVQFIVHECFGQSGEAGVCEAQQGALVHRYDFLSDDRRVCGRARSM